MQISISDTIVRGSDIFLIIWRGYFVGASVIILPLTLIIVIGNLFVAGSEFQWPMIFAPVMGLAIAAIQGVIVGGLVLLGLRIRPPRNPENREEHDVETAAR